MKLKELRLKHHLIQQELANILNIPKSTYVKYELESTQAPIEIYIKLANYYNVSGKKRNFAAKLDVEL